jgi:hypothetical protein
MGVIIRTQESIFALRQRFPHLKAEIKADDNPGRISNVRSPNWMRKIIPPTLQHLLGGDKAQSSLGTDGKTIYTVYIKDDTELSAGSEERWMGLDPKGNQTIWSYRVRPGEMLYPRGRMLVCSKDLVFYDGPNIYWHGQIPVIKIPSDLSCVYPGHYLSKPLTTTLIPFQEIIYELINGLLDAIRKILRPNVFADARAVGDGKMRAFDPRVGGQKMRINPVAGAGIKYEDPPIIPPFVLDFLNLVLQTQESVSGAVDLKSLMQAKQMPAPETIDAFMQAMTPATRLRSRLLEVGIRELGEMLKVNFFQFYTAPRRVAILGEGGLDMEDFDYDPGTLVPDSEGMFSGTAMEGQSFADYKHPERHRRAISHAKQFPFYVTPNSLLELALISKKLMYVQLRRMWEIDHRTLLEMLEVPKIDEIDQRLASEIDKKIMAMQQAQAGTAGRKPTAQVSPHLETHGGRGTISES